MRVSRIVGPSLGDDVGVGFDLPADDHLAEAERGLDHDARRVAGRRVDGEHHSRALGVDHALHDHRDRRLVGDALRRAVRQHASAEQRRPAVDDALEQLLVPVHVGERLVHARERRRRRVLGGRRRSHRDELVGAEPVVRVEHVPRGARRGIPALCTSSRRSETDVFERRLVERSASGSRRARGDPIGPRRGRRPRDRPPRSRRSPAAPAVRPGSTRRGWRPCRRRPRCRPSVMSSNHLIRSSTAFAPSGRSVAQHHRDAAVVGEDLVVDRPRPPRRGGSARVWRRRPRRRTPVRPPRPA